MMNEYDLKTITDLLYTTGKTGEQIFGECMRLAELLLKKNAAYGNSALDPVRVFSKANTVEQIKVRIDDKLSRLSRGHAMEDETLDETVTDLMGYLVLLKIALQQLDD